MKTISQDCKNNLKSMGRQLKHYLNAMNVILDEESIVSVTPHFEGNILKSVMKQLDIEVKERLAMGNGIEYKLGVLVNDDYEWIDYGYYIIYSEERDEEKNTYKYTCYDRMLYSMKKYIKMNIQYPIDLRNYINAVANALGYVIDNPNDYNFANSHRMIPTELYLTSDDKDIGYTFRDILDDIAEATASTLCLNGNKLEMRYINDTYEVIDENILKDVNLSFGEKYGPVNSVVLSRSGESDNVYQKDDTSIQRNGLTEIKIIDNQIMNDNNRADFLPDIFAKLNGLTYALNDYTSTGILYLDLCDKYSVHANNNSYSCIMFNDEVQITQGIVENIYTEKPDETETDYTKGDKDDRRLNQTYIMVDKQNQRIDAVITNVGEQDNKIAQLTQTVDELTSKISDISDITTSAETSYATVDVTGINESEPIMIKIHPNLVNISYLYPRANLYPSDDLYMTDRRICFHNTTNNTKVYYTLPDDLLWYNQNVYDEFYFDWESTTCQVIKRCGYNADGSVYALQSEVTTNYPFPTIHLNDGAYTISLPGYNYGYLFVRLVASNIYTSQFATKIEMTSAINQKANEISLVVNQKLNNNDFTHASIVAKINDDTSQILIEADKVNITANDVINILAGNTLNLTSKTISITSTNFSVTPNGTVTMQNANIRGVFKNYSSITGYIGVQISNTAVRLYDWKNSGVWVGNVSSIYTDSTQQSGIALTCGRNGDIVIGYKNSENDSSVNTLMSFDTRDLSSVPWIINTGSGKLSLGHDGITIKNGFVTDWDIRGVTGGIFAHLNDGAIQVKNGIITSWNLGGAKTGTIPIGETGITVASGLITDWDIRGVTGEVRLKSGYEGYVAVVTIKNGIITSVVHEQV